MDENKNLSENILDIKKLDLWYGGNHALKDVNMEIKRNAITAFIGPSGCGKSTFLKTLNRMNDLVPGVRIEGQVILDGVDIYDPKVDTSMLRKKIGMVFQQPNPFPMSIYDNVAYGPRIHGIKNKAKLDQIVEESLRGAAIFDEVKDRLKKSALGLSGGQYPLHVLNVYISYGVTLGNSIDGTYAEKCLYNKEFVNIMWKVYTETTTNYECYKKYQVLKAKNVINSGYIKMDYFVEKHQYSDDYIRKIWPFPSGSDIKGYKRVLITPHFSVGNTNILSFSTFDKNMYFYIYLAKKYRDNVSFIFKPHPNLRRLFF